MLLLGDEFPPTCMSAGVRDVAGRGRPKPPFAMRATRKLTPPPKKRKEKVKINFFTILQMRQSPVQAGERLRKKKAESWCRQRIPWRFTLTGSHPRLPSSVAALRSNSSPSRWRPARESRRGGRGGAGRLPRRHSQGPASIRLVRGLPGRPHWQGCALHALGDAGRRRASERGPARVPGPAPVLRAPSRPGLLRPPPPACTGPMADLPGDPARRDLPRRSLRSRGRSVSNSSYGAAGVSARLSFRPCEFLLHVV